MKTPICDREVKIIYKNQKPYGIRDASGFLFFFADISKYQGQEERYRLEIERQFSLADYLLSKLLMVRELTPPTPATEYPTAVIKEVKPETHSVDSTQAGTDPEKSFERRCFERWYSTNAFDFERNPIGSRECGLQWAAWLASANLTKPALQRENDELKNDLESSVRVTNETVAKFIELRKANDQLFEQGQKMFAERNALREANDTFASASIKRTPTAWRSKENYSPDVGSWYEYYDAFREVNDTTGLTPLYE